MNTVKLLFFATLRDRIGSREAEMDLASGVTVRELKSLLGDKYPSAGPTISAAVVSVNKEFAFDADVIPEGAEIAIFPPVSGG